MTSTGTVQALTAIVVVALATTLHVTTWRTRLATDWQLPSEPAGMDGDRIDEALREHLTSVVGFLQTIGASTERDAAAGSEHVDGGSGSAVKRVVSHRAPADDSRPRSLPSFTELYRRHKFEDKRDPNEWREAPHTGYDAAEIAQGLVTAYSALQQLQPQWQENTTFAINTVDKLKYQLDNLEPMRHALSRPQWNPKRMQDQPPSIPGRVRKNFMMGISSVNRKENYLLETLRSFIDALSPDEKQSIKIVVFNAHVPPSGHEDIPRVRSQFAEEISSGFLTIVERPDGARPHPAMADPEKLTRRWGDDLDRVKWRSKQVLDVAYLMDYAVQHREGFEYFLMMEDDIVASRSWPSKIRSYVDNWLYRRTDWTMASFYNPWPDVRNGDLLPPFKFFGVIGQLFRMHDLPVVVEFLRKNFDQSPLDWLFVDYLKKFDGRLIQHSPSYFQHKGRVSSLDNKIQTGSSVDFDG